jgi:phosphoribosylaminoimidazole-succinocarboxamide synthase
MGSVKDLYILKEPTLDESGTGEFVFSDRYSVFDWGKMPDDIPYKGKSIAILGAYFFEKLEKTGIKTHYLGMVENGNIKSLSSLSSPSSKMRIKLLRVLYPEYKDGAYNYSCYLREKKNFLIPLEIIYRNILTEKSSILKHLQRGRLRDFGLSEMPPLNQWLKQPLIDLSSKLEAKDRYISWSEAEKILNLTKTEIEFIKDLTKKINQMITDEFSKIGLINQDGKIEIGFDENRHIILVDVLGTLDECRFTYQNIPLSKEIARIHYRGTEWHQAVEEAKRLKIKDWKSKVKINPLPLPQRLKELISMVYCACTNEITQRKWFDNIPCLDEIVTELKQVLQL